VQPRGGWSQEFGSASWRWSASVFESGIFGAELCAKEFRRPIRIPTTNSHNDLRHLFIDHGDHPAYQRLYPFKLS
jgi:hypothetical protein